MIPIKGCIKNEICDYRDEQNLISHIIDKLPQFEIVYDENQKSSESFFQNVYNQVIIKILYW